MTDSLSQPLPFYSNFQYYTQQLLKKLFSLNLTLHQQGQPNTRKVNETAEWKIKPFHKLLEMSSPAQEPTAETKRSSMWCSLSGPYRKVDRPGTKELTRQLGCSTEETQQEGLFFLFLIWKLMRNFSSSYILSLRCGVISLPLFSRCSLTAVLLTSFSLCCLGLTLDPELCTLYWNLYPGDLRDHFSRLSFHNN